ncbi:hypothetical protein MPH_01021 [Macrophomina phaseolina MS6]|uniref:Nucleoside phosphorylase domain-containing protein n=1 Tax=Macrophomina phaseolina (strain MS6) TaxID=1126212 RepID=K2S3Z9_MACPH|nr:hypothetical protein MPH_01021 [Macrophomina phaseolina MS6]
MTTSPIHVEESENTTSLSLPSKPECAASSMLSKFSGIRSGLLVGKGGAIPRLDRPGIRLGDIVVSEPSGSNGGVIQHDLVKLGQDGQRERRDFLNAPPDALLFALSSLKTHHEMKPSRVPTILQEMEQRYPYMFQTRPGAPGYRLQGLENDRLFDKEYAHRAGTGCVNCMSDGEIYREPRVTRDPVIHCGTIASGNTLVKDTRPRKKLLQHLSDKCLCYEIEAAGMINNFPCLIIRGISDYCDSNNNDRWQRSATATAAAFGKELLEVVRRKEVERQNLLMDGVKLAFTEKAQGCSRRDHSTSHWRNLEAAGERQTAAFESRYMV